MKLSNYESIGLESRDIRVYEALYQLHDASLRTLAAETGLNRGTVYEIIKKLTQMGLVSFTQSGERRRFMAADPAVLTSLVHEQRDRLQQLEVQAVAYAHALQQSRGTADIDYFARFYEGDQGVVSILRDVLQTVAGLERKEYCVISARAVSGFIYAHFKSFSRQRIKQGIYARVLADQPAAKVALSERRQLATGGSTLNGYILIYGNKTALISLDEANHLSGIIIEDKGITTLQRIIFDQLWQASGGRADV